MEGDGAYLARTGRDAFNTSGRGSRSHLRVISSLEDHTLHRMMTCCSENPVKIHIASIIVAVQAYIT